MSYVEVEYQMSERHACRLMDERRIAIGREKRSRTANCERD